MDDPQFPGYSVEDACSGLRSLLALTAIAAVYAYLTQKSLWRKWALFLASIPIAIVGNVVRITTVVVVDQGFSRNLAGGLYHDYSTYFLRHLLPVRWWAWADAQRQPPGMDQKWKSIASDLTLNLIVIVGAMALLLAFTVDVRLVDTLDQPAGCPSRWGNGGPGTAFLPERALRDPVHRRQPAGRFQVHQVRGRTRPHGRGGRPNICRRHGDPQVPV
ncbi:MAG: archaeosortase/exosortase family protein [Kiritimatiellia bacterium]